MVDDRSSRRSRRRRRRRRSACRPQDFRRAYDGFHRQADAPALLRGTEADARHELSRILALLRRAPSRVGRRSSTRPGSSVDESRARHRSSRCRCRLPQAGEGARARAAGCSVTAPGEGNERLDVRTLALARETLAAHSGLADFAFAMQGLGAGPISLFGNAAQRAAWLPKTRAGDGDRRLRADRAGLRLRRRQYRHHRPARRRRLRARRREDLDLQRRHRRSLCRVRPHRRGAWRARAVGLHRRGRQSRPEDRRAHARHRAASAGAAALRELPRAGERDDRQAGRGLQDRDGDARRVPHHGRRRGARLCPPRARRNAQARVATRTVRRADGRSADGAGPSRRHGARDRRRGAARLSRRLDEGHGRRPRHQGSGDGQALRHRSGAARHRRRGATAWRRRRARRPSGRDALSRDPGAAHLRRRLRRPESRHCPGRPVGNAEHPHEQRHDSPSVRPRMSTRSRATTCRRSISGRTSCSIARNSNIPSASMPASNSPTAWSRRASATMSR